MFQYRAHGCTIESTAPIPDLPPAVFTASPDLRIVFDGPSLPGGRSDAFEVWFESPYRTPDGSAVLRATRQSDGSCFRLEYVDGPVFLVDEFATTVRVMSRGSSVDDACSYLLGPVIGLVLRMRGLLCLHASAVSIDGRAVAFVGSAGAGKSTIAAAFAGAGFNVLSDDTLTIRRGDAEWLAAPGYPRVRLWPDAAAALAPSRARPDVTRRVHLDIAAQNRYAPESIPLAAVYLIEYADAPSPRVELMTAAEAMPELAANTFASRALTREQRAQEFAGLADLLSAVPVSRLLRPFGLNAIGAVLETVVDDVAATVRAV